MKWHVVIILICVFFKQIAFAASEESLFVPLESRFLLPQSNPFSQIKLNSKTGRRRIRVHGLRLAPLDASIWGVRRLDRTDSRNLVPIRPLYLRVSEEPSFQLKKLQMNFQFEPAKMKKIMQDRSRLDPVLDIRFAGTFLEGLPLDRPSLDQGYVLRLSGFPLLKSGLYFHSGQAYKALESAFMPEQIQTGKLYQVTLAFSSKSVNVELRSKEEVYAQELQLEAANKGLVSLITSWHPISLEELKIEGEMHRDGKRVALHQSGLISFHRKG